MLTSSARLFAAPLLAALALAASTAAQHALFLDGTDLVASRLPTGTALRDVLVHLLAGPSERERARGLTTALPSRTTLDAVAIDESGARVRVTLGKRFLLAVRQGDRLELAIEQLAKTVFQSEPRVRAVDLAVTGLDGIVRPLPDVLDRWLPRAHAGAAEHGSSPPAPDSTIPGALNGRRIVVSPGHGYYWHSTLGWTTQRGNIGGLIEDIHTNEIAFRYLIPYLENLGADVISCRERSEIPHEVVGDNDAGTPTYAETGLWNTSGSAGFGGGTYRFASTSPTGTTTATATWTIGVPADGTFPVYAHYRAGTNRAPDAVYVVHHTGGSTEVVVDQTRDDRTWRFLGEFRFAAATPARIELTNRGTPARVVIADAIKVGAGFGSIARGAGTSGQLRWREAARYWTQYSGAPSSVYNSVSSGQDNSDDVTARPRFAEWRGADVFVSLHTNAGGGSGTSTFIYNGGATAGSTTLQSRIHDQIVGDVRRDYDPTWIDRGKRQANFGEVRLLSTMPGTLIELAFHDQPGTRDHDALRDPVFRRLGARAIARGVLRYFAPTATFPPEPPPVVWVTQDGARGLHVAWDPVAGATSYVVEISPDGKGFVEGAQVTGATSWASGPLPLGAVRSFRVRAVNASGRSFASDVLTAGTAHWGSGELLLVQGFDRLDPSVLLPDNTTDYLARHGRAIRDAGTFSLAFDAATNEAVKLGRVQLTSYRAVDWACGEESTRDETFDATEQALVRAYLNVGGRLLVTGAEIGWDLDARGNASDRDFYRNVLGAIHTGDDAQTYSFEPLAGGLFGGLPIGTFDNGSQGTYDVDWPDRVAPTDALSTVAIDYRGGLGGGAAIVRDDGVARVVHLGFPLETIVSPTLRADLMERALRFLLSPRALEAPATVALGTTAPLRIDAPAFGGRPYLLAAALAVEPAQVLPGGALLPLAPDGVFAASLAPGPAFTGMFGTLDAQGRATGGFVVPQLAVLSGLELYVSGITLALANPPLLGQVLPWVRLRVQ